MPEVTVSKTLSRSPEEVWDFVKDMNNWAPMLTGYVSHKIETDTTSQWTLQGDAGVMTRTVVLKVDITEWNGPQRVAFTLQGQGEAVEGSGTFEIQPTNEADGVPQHTTEVSIPLTWWQRVLAWFSGLVVPRQGATEDHTTSEPAASVLVYRLHMSALGPTAPMVNAMLSPWIAQSTEDLAARIVAHLETGSVPDQY